MGSFQVVPIMKQSGNHIPQTKSVAFRSEIRASGAGETWSHTDDELKFQQFGWRCTNDENAYKEDVLIGNWNEKQFDVSRVVNNVRTNSPYEHYYETTYKAGYKNKSAVQIGQERLEQKKSLLNKEIARTYPARQPELYIEPTEKLITTSQLAYGVGSKKTSK